MAEAPTGDDTLHEDDAMIILEALLDAQNQSYKLGLRLNLPLREVEAIFTKYSDPSDRLLHIIIAFLRRAEPRPTWRVIVAALRSPAVGLTALARRVEAAHCHDLTATRDVVPETTAPAVNDGVKPKPAASPAQSSTTNSSQHARGRTVRRLVAQVIEKLTRNEVELTRQGAELMTKEAEQQQMRQRETELVQAKDRAQQQLRQKGTELIKAQQQLRQKTQPGLLATAVPHSIPAKPRKLTVQCRQKKKRAPHYMVRGSAATDGRFVYITPDGSYSLYQYECSSEEWMELPSCPYYYNSGLAIIDSELTTVGGGVRAGRRTNRLLTLRQGKWVEVYPPMNTARFGPAVVSTSDGDYLIVIGGFGSEGVETAAVELFRVKSRRWYTLTDLPQPLPRPSATLCGDQLHAIGSDDKGYSCSLQSLPSNDRPITSPLTLSWKPLPPLPVERSTAATLCGQLVLIGGGQDLSSVNSIRQLVEGQWVEIGSTSDRTLCLAVNLSPDRILIVGGWEAECSVEECVVTSL